MNDKTKQIKKVFSITGRILSTLFLVCSIALCVYVFVTNYTCNKNGEEPFYFGYRPCLIQTGSMEPYMMTNGIIMTKEVNSIDEIEVGDVVTYTAQNSTGETIYITHRIIDITEDGIITTQGDNNRVDDGFPLTMDNIIAKTVGVYNQPSVWLINTWTSGNTGKVIIVAICLAIILLLYAAGTLISGWLNDDEIDTGAIAEYSKLCRKLGRSPAKTFEFDLDHLRSLYETEASSDSLAEGAESASAEGETVSDEARSKEVPESSNLSDTDSISSTALDSHSDKS